MTVDERDAEERKMKDQIGEAAYEALVRLNWHYGCGEPAAISFVNRTAERTVGHVTLRITSGQLRRRFRIEGSTLHYRGHQKKFA